MKSIIIQSKETKIKLISQLAFNLTKKEIEVIERLFSRRSENTFMLDNALKSFLIAKIGGNDGSVRTVMSRLIKKGAIIKSGRMYGLHSAYKDCEMIQQLVIRF